MPIYVGSKKVKHIIHIKQYEYNVDSNARYVYSLARGTGSFSVNLKVIADGNTIYSYTIKGTELKPS